MNARKSTSTHRLTRVTVAMLALALAGSVSAGPKGRPHFDPFPDQARVVAKTPVFEEINEPRRECWIERISHGYEAPRERSYGGAILGTIIGGVIGHQFGKGTGKTVATAVGAATGAMVGDGMDNRAGATWRGPEEVERCRSVDQWTRRLTGYNIVYRYQGREYSAFMPYDPGEFVRVNVSVSLAESW